MIKQKSSVLSYEGVPSQQVNELYILYGSRSGNAKGAAILAYEYATYLGISSKCISMDEFPFDNLSDVRNLIICVSTHGEGDPPVPAESFYQHLHQPGLPAFNDIHYAVLALGDSSYKHYCQTGTDMDSRLESLGGKRIHPLATCDLDFEENAKDWIKKTVEAFKTHLRIESSAKKNSFVFKIASNDVESNAFSAKIIEKRRLSKEGSTKNVMHVALDITGSGIDYKAGDSIGIYSYNSRLLVDKFLKVLKLEGTSFIEFKGKIKLLKEALIQHFELTVLTPLVITKYASLINNSHLNELVQDEVVLNQYAESRNVLDLLTDFPAYITAGEFVSILRKLSPRLYSVSCSPLLYPNEIHVTVGIIDYKLDGRKHEGVCSSHLSSRLEEGEKVHIVLESNEKFSLPEDQNKPIIMISTGTGIAPFRAFLQEREAASATGKNWLFFGDRNEKSDFLYHDELMDFKRKGILTHLDLAFSRDQPTPNHIHERMLDKSTEIIQWINEDAVIYVCGNKRTMAKSVRQALIHLICQELKLTKSEAKAYFERLKSAKRYLEDVY